jgi:5-methyltetrahydropteroyltriglutamate--homocysteine methyltransferase
MVGAIPSRFGTIEGKVDWETYFAMARGTSTEPAMEMTKWFDTNYHYIVPEFEANQKFHLASTKPIDEFIEAKALGIHTRPVLIGPLTYLWLGKMKNGAGNPLTFLDQLTGIYVEVLQRLSAAGADWIQIDEPILGLPISEEFKTAIKGTYKKLSQGAPSLKLLVAVYFSDLRDNLETLIALPVSGIHIDLVRAESQLGAVLDVLPDAMSLSLGLIDGRNIWKTNLGKVLPVIQRTASILGSERVMVAPSSSLLHTPVDLDLETELDEEMKSWLAFARQKIQEITVLTGAINDGAGSVETDLKKNAMAMESRRISSRIHNPTVTQRLKAINDSMLERKSPFPERQSLQGGAFPLPLFPTTTIGSFPQTAEIRKARADLRKGLLTSDQYEHFLEREIEGVVRFQEEIGLDVLVHGEPERNDMVEYFGEQLAGYISTKNGWVQSYGSRAVKPPIIFGDVQRSAPMTVKWTQFAQSLTIKPMKGMLTGPVTMLQWSFVRDDQPRPDTCRQLALAIRDEVHDLEQSGIRVIQIDEPAFREGLPLRQEDWDIYLKWAVECFRLTSSGVSDTTQIHTHMCYSEFNDIIEAIGDMDADVISIESSRSDMEILESFSNYKYPNEIGPGVYDIHSPRVAPIDEMKELLEKALGSLSANQLWVNPDCGLKTRRWPEVIASLDHMVKAALQLREEVR